MQVEIIALIVVVIAVVAVAADTAAHPELHEGLGELAAGPERDADGQVAGLDRGDGVAAGQADREDAGTAAGAPRSRFALRNWSVRSRLILLVAVPSLTAIVLAVA